MNGLLVVTVRMHDGTVVIKKYAKKWSTARGKKRVQESCLNEAMLACPNWESMDAKWETDVRLLDTEDGKGIVLVTDDLGCRTAVHYVIGLQNLNAKWDGMWRVELPEHEAAHVVTELRKAGVTVSY